jgi:hypothetical protein
LAPQFPHADQLQFVGITWLTQKSKGYRLWALTQERLQNHRGPTYLVRRNDADAKDAMNTVREILPTSRVTDCKPIQTNMATLRTQEDVAMGLSLCRLKRG